MAVKDNLNYRNLFEVPIFQQIIDINVDDILTLINTENTSVNKSNIGGWQSDNICDTPKYHNLLSTIEIHINDFANKLNMKYVQKINNAWININYKDSYNSKHIHPNSMLSGVVYLKTLNNCGDITFYHPLGHQLQYDWDKNNFNSEHTYNSYCWDMPVLEKCLYIFPSWLSHSVNKNTSDSERISIAFNTINADRLC